MKMKVLFATTVFCFFFFVNYAQQKPILLKHVTIIDGNGGKPLADADVLIKGDSFAGIGKNLKADNAVIKDMTGKTIMPALISGHSHTGNITGTQSNAANYTRDNLLHHLKRYEQYGVGALLCMGTDRPLIFNGFRDSSVAGLLPGARMYSAGFGFGMPGNPPAVAFGMNHTFISGTDPEIAKQVAVLAKLKPSFVKIWVDDFGGSNKKMPEDIYREIIKEAHKHGLRVASHVYYLEDAHKLIDAGVDILAHSIRDKEIDNALLKKMKEKNIIYIPTLTREIFEFIYAENPVWINDDFFKTALEPGVYEMLRSPAYINNIKKSPGYARNKKGLEIAIKNLKKIYDAGIMVVMGTDSGATPARAEGFAEHLELELMVSAGLTPLQAITISTKNAAKFLSCNKDYGTIETGRKADFIVLSGNPEKNILNTRNIEVVWKNGEEVKH
ncbi:MAG: amidohydrolase [Sphingobacteriales bacterium 40-81]|nr:MAG: amidohydrolase [Sphingobacteriales bacterium 40-81]